MQLGHEVFIGFICLNDQSYGQGMNPPDFRGTGEFWSGNFCGAELLQNFRGGMRAVVVFGIFWPISYKIKNWLFISLYLYFIKIWWKSYIFPKNPSNNFYEILAFMQFLVFYTARLFYILLHATILGVTLKGLVSVCSELSSFSGW